MAGESNTIKKRKRDTDTGEPTALPLSATEDRSAPTFIAADPCALFGLTDEDDERVRRRCEDGRERDEEAAEERAGLGRLHDAQRRRRSQQLRQIRNGVDEQLRVGHAADGRQNGRAPLARLVARQRLRDQRLVGVEDHG